jgi:hypothetical protein
MFLSGLLNIPGGFRVSWSYSFNLLFIIQNKQWRYRDVRRHRYNARNNTRHIGFGGPSKKGKIDTLPHELC